ncbi:MAG: glycosyltransferase family 2 protein [Candidatus Natronoplasma sp.]
MNGVSVILPTFNREDKVGRAVKSVLYQTYKNFELIVVDDVSTDSTPEVVKSFDDDRIVYHRNESNLGGGGSRNVGIKLSENDLIAFLDDDDEWLPTKLEKQMGVMKEASPLCCGVYTGLKKIIDGKVVSEKINRKEGNLLHELLWENIIGSTSVVLLKKEPVIEVGAFTESLPASQELELYLRLSREYEFRCVPQPLVRYHVHRDDQITADHSKKLKAKRYIFNKFEDEIKADPPLHAKYLYEIAYRQHKLGNYEEAKEMFKKGFFLSPLGLKYLIKKYLSKLILGI